MAERILKAVEFEKCSAKFKKQYVTPQALWDAGWLLQPKYDGCFGMALIKSSGGSQMLSRTGEDYTTSCMHILIELAEAADEQSPGAGWDDFVVLGEVWHGEYAFPKISGLFRKRAASGLVFMANDILPPMLLSKQPYAQRLNDLKALLPEMDPDMTLGDNYYTAVVGSVQYDDETSPETVAMELKGAGGYDGAILRDPRAGYSIGLARDGQIVKVKPVLSLDLRVVELTEVVGEKTGRPVYTIGVTYQGVVSEVGSGIPHKLPDDLVCGAIVEVECLGVTEDGKLREPRFKGVRYDKDGVDG